MKSIRLGGAEESFATILFADIRSFATIAEPLSPTATLDFLNTFMQQMHPVIQKHQGFINQFAGDEIMAVFHNDGHADAALKAAFDMRETLDRLNHEREGGGEVPIEMGIGINSGRIIWGEMERRTGWSLQ